MSLDDLSLTVSPETAWLVDASKPSLRPEPTGYHVSMDSAWFSDIEQFIIDASNAVVSEVALPNAPLEHRALRASWLKALQAIGWTEEGAREKGRGLWMRAPK